MVEAAMSGVKLLDLFSGIGGFHLGFERAGFEFDYVGFAEVDKYASAVYKYNNPFAEELGDVKSIRSKNLPKIDIITFGSPCQDFSIAGKRAGATEGTRSSLIWEAIRLITECKPRVFVWENVKGTFSSNDGADFWAIIQAFTNIGSYRLEWQLLNTRWFLPQNRERLYLVGYTGDRGGRSVFPIGEDGKAITSKRKSRNAVSCIDASYHKGPDGKRTMINVVGSTLSTGAKGTNSRHWVYDSNGITGALSATDYKQPKQIKIADYRNDEGLRVRKDSVSPTLATRKHSQTDISTMPPFVWKENALKQVGELKITAKKRSYDTPKEINEYLKANKNGKTIREIAESLDLPKTQVEHYFRSDKSRAIPSPDHWLLLKKLLGFDDTFDKEVTDIYEKEVEFESSRRVYSAEGISKTLDTHESGYYQVQPVIDPRRHNKSQNGRLIKEDGEDMFTLTQQDQHGVKINQTSIRRLTPVECMRLQGFPDNHNEFGLLNGKKVAISDTQRYKQAGNAVTVDVVAAVARKIKELL
jgi:DNA (cytosine-5)-methyltransferase 1